MKLIRRNIFIFIITAAAMLTLIFGCAVPFIRGDTDTVIALSADSADLPNSYTLTLSTDTYAYLYSDSTIFGKTLTITNGADNPDSILITITNSAGAYIFDEAISIEAGNAVKVKIPSGTGNYVIYVKPSSNGSYFITVA